MNDRYLSVAKICLYFGIKKDTVYKCIDKKGFSDHRIGKFWKFKISEVNEWVEIQEK